MDYISAEGLQYGLIENTWSASTITVRLNHTLEQHAVGWKRISYTANRVLVAASLVTTMMA